MWSLSPQSAYSSLDDSSQTWWEHIFNLEHTEMTFETWGKNKNTKITLYTKTDTVFSSHIYVKKLQDNICRKQKIDSSGSLCLKSLCALVFKIKLPPSKPWYDDPFSQISVKARKDAATDTCIWRSSRAGHHTKKRRILAYMSLHPGPSPKYTKQTGGR